MCSLCKDLKYCVQMFRNNLIYLHYYFILPNNKDEVHRKQIASKECDYTPCIKFIASKSSTYYKRSIMILILVHILCLIIWDPHYEGPWTSFKILHRSTSSGQRWRITNKYTHNEENTRQLITTKKLHTYRMDT